MNVFYHFSSILYSNTYLIGPDGGGDAILIDPGDMDAQLLRIIEANNYYVRTILVTLPHPSQVHGVRTLLKIYDSKLYGNTESLYECRAKKLHDGERVYLSGFEVRVIKPTKDPLGPLVYVIGNLVFPGMLYTAGNVISGLGRRGQMEAMEQFDEQVLSLPDSALILPGVGPPASVRSERFLRQKKNN